MIEWLKRYTQCKEKKKKTLSSNHQMLSTRHIQITHKKEEKNITTVDSQYITEKLLPGESLHTTTYCIHLRLR